MFGQFFLAGNRAAAFHLETCVFLAGNHIGDDKSTREEETKFEKLKPRKPREKPRKEKKREIFNEEHRKAEKNRVKDKTLIYTD